MLVYALQSEELKKPVTALDVLNRAHKLEGGRGAFVDLVGDES